MLWSIETAAIPNRTAVFLQNKMVWLLINDHSFCRHSQRMHSAAGWRCSCARTTRHSYATNRLEKHQHGLLNPADIRNARKELREGTIDQAEYEKRVEAYMGYAIDVQEKVGLDVLVHGEPERSDM